MPLSLTVFSDGTSISASDIRDRVQDIEEYLNEGIVGADIKDTSPWVDSSKIYKPDFFRSPSPRAEMVSGDTWYRFRADGRENYAIFHPYATVDTWIPIPGASATVRNPLSYSVEAYVLTNLYVLTVAGTGYIMLPYDTRSARIELRRDGLQMTGTRREVFATPSSPGSIEGRENVSIFGRTTLSPGTHSIEVRIALDDVTWDSGMSSGTDPDWKHTFVGVRSLIVDAPHLIT
jgi:hypothetical protein